MKDLARSSSPDQIPFRAERTRKGSAAATTPSRHHTRSNSRASASASASAHPNSDDSLLDSITVSRPLTTTAALTQPQPRPSSRQSRSPVLTQRQQQNQQQSQSQSQSPRKVTTTPTTVPAAPTSPEAKESAKIIPKKEETPAVPISSLAPISAAEQLRIESERSSSASSLLSTPPSSSAPSPTLQATQESPTSRPTPTTTTTTPTTTIFKTAPTTTTTSAPMASAESSKEEQQPKTVVSPSAPSFTQAPRFTATNSATTTAAPKPPTTPSSAPSSSQPMPPASQTPAPPPSVPTPAPVMSSTPPTAKWTPIGRAPVPRVSPSPVSKPPSSSLPQPPPPAPPASQTPSSQPPPSTQPVQSSPEGGTSLEDRQQRQRMLYMKERRRIADRIKAIMSHLIEQSTGNKQECVTMSPAKGATWKIIGPTTVLEALAEPEQHYITGMSTELRKLVPHLLREGVLKVVKQNDTTTQTETYEPSKWKTAVDQDWDDGWDAKLKIGSNKPFANLSGSDLALVGRGHVDSNGNSYTPRKRTFSGVGPLPNQGPGASDAGADSSSSPPSSQATDGGTPAKRPRGRPKGFRPPPRSKFSIANESWVAKQHIPPGTAPPPGLVPNSQAENSAGSPQDLARRIIGSVQGGAPSTGNPHGGSNNNPAPRPSNLHPVARKSFPPPHIPQSVLLSRASANQQNRESPQSSHFPSAPFPSTAPPSQQHYMPQHQHQQQPPPPHQKLPSSSQYQPPSHQYNNNQPPPPPHRASLSGSSSGEITYPPFVRKLEELQEELEVFRAFLSVAYDSEDSGENSNGEPTSDDDFDSADEDVTMDGMYDTTTNGGSHRRKSTRNGEGRNSKEVAKKKIRDVEKEIKKVRKLGRQYEELKPKSEKFERCKDLCEAIEREILGVC